MDRLLVPGEVECRRTGNITVHLQPIPLPKRSSSDSTETEIHIRLATLARSFSKRAATVRVLQSVVSLLLDQVPGDHKQKGFRGSQLIDWPPAYHSRDY